MKGDKKVTTCVNCLAVVEYVDSDIKREYFHKYSSGKTYIVCPACKDKIYLQYIPYIG